MENDPPPGLGGDIFGLGHSKGAASIGMYSYFMAAITNFDTSLIRTWVARQTENGIVKMKYSFDF